MAGCRLASCQLREKQAWLQAHSKAGSVSLPTALPPKTPQPGYSESALAARAAGLQAWSESVLEQPAALWLPKVIDFFALPADIREVAAEKEVETPAVAEKEQAEAKKEAMTKKEAEEEKEVEREGAVEKEAEEAEVEKEVEKEAETEKESEAKKEKEEEAETEKEAEVERREGG